MSLNSSIEEKSLLLKLREGDSRAFEKLYFTYSKNLYGNLLSMVKSTEIAEELLQDIFQRVWERRTSIDMTKSFKSYLFTIGKHLVYDFFHRQTKQRHIEAYLISMSSELYHHVDETVAHKETQAILQEAIHKLPPQRKLVYTLCKIEGKSYEEVGRLLGISTSTISDHIVKATKSLKTHYTAQHALAVVIALYIIQ